MSSTTRTWYLVLLAVGVALSAASDGKHDAMISAAVDKIQTDLAQNAPQLHDSAELGATIANTLDTWMHELDVSVKTGHLRNFVGASSKHGLTAVHPETGLTHDFHDAAKNLATLIMNLRNQEAEQKATQEAVARGKNQHPPRPPLASPAAERALEETIQIASGDHDAPVYLGESMPGVHSFNLGGADVKSTSTSATGRLLADAFPDTYGEERGV